jgi:hypothetical protein
VELNQRIWKVWEILKKKQQKNKCNCGINQGVIIITIIKSRRMRWAGHVARLGEKRNAYRILVGKPEEKRPLGRPRRR